MCKTITLRGGVLMPLREALYSRLIEATDDLNEALTARGREHSTRSHLAYQQLCAAGGLLDRLGWLQQESQAALTLQRPGETRLVIDALTVELGVEAELASSARKDGGPDAALATERRWEAVHVALWHVEAAMAAAQLTDIEQTDDA